MTKWILGLVAAVALVIPASAGAQCLNHQSSGKRVFHQVWRVVHADFGAPLRPFPRLFVLERGGWLSQVGITPDGFRRIEVTPLHLSMLAGHSGCRMQLKTIEAVIHEFTHLYQNDNVFLGTTPDPRVLKGEEPWWWNPGPEIYYEGLTEGTAEAFAMRLMKRRYGVTRDDFRVKRDAYDVYEQEMLDQLKPGFIFHGQLRDFWGKDPRTAPYPTG